MSDMKKSCGKGGGYHAGLSMFIQVYSIFFWGGLGEIFGYPRHGLVGWRELGALTHCFLGCPKPWVWEKDGNKNAKSFGGKATQTSGLSFKRRELVGIIWGIPWKKRAFKNDSNLSLAIWMNMVDLEKNIKIYTTFFFPWMELLSYLPGNWHIPSLSALLSRWFSFSEGWICQFPGGYQEFTPLKIKMEPKNHPALKSGKSSSIHLHFLGSKC